MGETQHQALEVRFDLREWKNGDKLVIKQGTYFSFNGTYIYFDEDVSAENYTVTWNTPANANVIVRANAEYLQDGEKMGGDVSLKTNAMVLKGTTLTITVEPTAIKYAVSSVKINGADQDTSGVYSYSVTSAVTIEAAVAEKSANAKKAEILNTIAANASTYITGPSWKVENGNLVATSTSSTVQFTTEFFNLLKEYGYNGRVTVTLSTTTTTNNVYSTRIRKGNSTINRAETINGATTYTAQYRTSRNGSYTADNNATWTLSNISVS